MVGSEAYGARVNYANALEYLTYGEIGAKKPNSHQIYQYLLSQLLTKNFSIFVI